MGALSFLRSVYDLDTLDTRFTTSSTTSYKKVRDDPNASKERAARFADKTHPSKWRTPEFYFYYFVFLFAIPAMFWVAIKASSPSNPHWEEYKWYLADGWIPGQKIDLSDPQYYTFRKNLPFMVVLLSLHPLLRRLYNSIIYPAISGGRSSRPNEEADNRLNQRASFDFGFALIYLTALHGVSILKILVILSINYYIAKKLPRSSIPIATWAFNIGVLFANELSDGYHFADFAARLTGSTDDSVALVAWGKWLDEYGGIIRRWEVFFNITVLRLISFNLDYYWSLDYKNYAPLEKKGLDPSALSERERVSIPAQPKDFSFRNYLAYSIYAPLYIAGPILTFNDYISQIRYKPASIETPRTIKYGVRFVLILLSMEILLQYIYVQAISKAAPTWGEYSAAQLCLLSFFNLHFIWLKLLLPWRMFRLWALIDGIDPPENMIRCVSNNYSTLSFWRSWHRSYNRWLTRYIYIPMGGSSFQTLKSSARSILNYAVTFTFVALWHDLKLRLLMWGWLVVFFMLPEMIGRAAVPARKWAARPTAYRMISAVGAVVNILMMMAANLVGFAVGMDGLESIVHSLFQDVSGIKFFVMACCAIFVGVQIMFEIRESELRRGIYLKC